MNEPKKILAIDDQADNLVTIKAVLKGNMPGCIVLTAASGKEGIEMARLEQPDTILLDIIMPEMDGYETCQLLKKDELTKHIPVVMLTAIKSDPQSRAKGLNNGADAFLSKPIDAGEVSAQVNVMLRIKEAEDQLRIEKKNLEKIVAERTFQLKESEEKYKALYENAPLPFQSLNEDGNLIDVNPAWLKIMGYNWEEVIGKWYGDFLHPDSKDIFIKNFPNLKSCGFVKDVPFQLKRKDDSYIDISLNGLSSYFPDGTFKQTYCVFEDITESKRANIELQKSEEQKSLILSTTHEGFWMVDLEGKFLMVNNSYCKIIGYSKEELLTMNVQDVEYHDSEKEVKERIKFVIENGPQRFESKHICKNGKIIDLDIGINYLPSNEIMFVFLHDITERKRNEDELLESEQRYSAFVNAYVDLTFVKDEQFRYVMANDKMAEFFGTSKEELVGKTDKELGGSTVAYPCQSSDEKALSSEKTFTVEEQLGNRIFETTKFPILLKGNKKGVGGIMHDITSRKLAEKAIVDSELKFRLIFENSPIGIYMGTNEGQIIDANISLLSILGSPSIEATKSINVLEFPPLIENGYAKKYTNCVENGLTIEFEMPYKTKWKKEVFLHSFLVPLKDANGNVEKVYTLVEDITERKKSEKVQTILYNISNAALSSINLNKLLRRIQKELSSIIDTTNFFIALYNKEEDTIDLPHFSDEYEVHNSFPVGKTLTRYVLNTKKSLLANKEKLASLEKEGLIERFGADSETWLGIPLKIDKEVMGVIVVQSYDNKNAFDKSDQRLLEFVSEQISQAIHRKKDDDELKRALIKATESDRLKSTFLATMSHELRTPLNAIIGFSDIIDEDLSIEEIISYNKIINTSGNHLLSIVNDLFDISLIETGEVAAFKRKIDIDSILGYILKLMKIEQQDINKQNVDLKLIVPEKQDILYINSDPNKLKQILINLIKNAMKFTSNGFVHFGYNLVEEVEGLHILFFVKDSGIGIAKNKQLSIFEMFNQIEDPRTRQYGGTGIGLSVAKRLTQLLGGDIWVESKLEIGSQFYIKFPLD